VYALAIALLVASLLFSVGFVFPAHASLVTISGQYQTVWINSTTHAYCVQNDVWDPDPGWVQEIQVNDQTGAFTVIGSSANDNHVSSYPSIVKGNAWGLATANSGLPMQVSGLNVETSWNISTINSGRWDAAYDIWFQNASQLSSTSSYSAEMMIWLSYTVQNPSSWYRGMVSIAGTGWDVYYCVFSGWNYIAYERISNTTYESFNLNTFAEDAVSRGYIQNSWYLVAVEAGFEISQGGVGLASNSFSVTPVQIKAEGSFVWWPLITIAAVVIAIAIAIAAAYVLRRKKQAQQHI
jgi:hypothetical protein